MSSEMLPGVRLADADGMPLERIGAFETEYGYSLGYKDDLSVRDEYGSQAMSNLAFRGKPSEFYEGGERIYLDVGTHPEYATPENPDFYSAAIQTLHGHVHMRNMMVNAAAKAGQSGSSEQPIWGVRGDEASLLARTKLIANTRDTARSSWASHENLLARRGLEPELYVNALATLYSTRIVWSGAGSVVMKNDKFAYHLSEKAPFIHEIASKSTTSQRALVNLRDEALADESEFRRIHTICGETVFSPKVNALRLVSASIVQRAVEVGENFSDLQLEDPVGAMKLISSDTTLRHRVRTVGGRRLTGLDVQYELAQRALKVAGKAGNLTEQERMWGEHWLGLVDRLKRSPDECVRVVDWVVKQRLIEKALAKPRPKDESDYAVALREAVEYHTILPKEGAGFQLLRRGFFEMSPTQSQLDNGMPIPESRAKNRGGLIQAAKEAGMRFQANWEVFGLNNASTIALKNPYGINVEEIQDYADGVGLKVDAAAIAVQNPLQITASIAQAV